MAIARDGFFFQVDSIRQYSSIEEFLVFNFDWRSLEEKKKDYCERGIYWKTSLCRGVLKKKKKKTRRHV